MAGAGPRPGPGRGRGGPAAGWPAANSRLHQDRPGGRGMSSTSTVTLAAAPARLADFFELTKPRITFLVLVTTAVGYAVGLSSGFDAAAFAALLAGTALVSGGASALNQYWER